MADKLSYLLGTILLLIPACGNSTKEQNINKHDLYIQLLSLSPMFYTLIQKVTPAINQYIKEKLELSSNYDFEFFIPKQAQRLSVYYLDDFYEDGDASLLADLDTKMHSMQTNFSQISLASDIEFFAGPFGINDELVIMIKDPNNALSTLNHTMQEMAHIINTSYKKRHKKDLYDIAKSEQFSYMPHMGIGRIRSSSIKEHMSDDTQFALLQEGIKQKVSEIIRALFVSHDTHLLFDTLCIFDVQKKECIKKYAL